MNAHYHAKSAAKKWGGSPEDYVKIIEFMDSSKLAHPDVRHRAILHNSFGIYIAEQVFGRTITVSKKGGGTKEVPVREIAEQHIIQDLGFIPTVSDWLDKMPIETWMGGKIHKTVSRNDFMEVK